MTARLFVATLGFGIVTGLVAETQALAQKPERSRGAAKAAPAEPKAEAEVETQPRDPAAPKAEGEPAEPGAKPAAADEGKEKGSESAGADEGKKMPEPGKTTELATFGAGCFWSIETIFENVKGVKSVVSGFSGGQMPFPTYKQVCTGRTGHAEAVQIEFDPGLVRYETLLQIFWAAHDPTTLNRQGDDYGPQYRSVIFYHNEDQKQAALKSYRELTARKVFRDPIVTQLVPMNGFYPAEAYHQDYFRNNRYSQYSLMYIVPKLKKLKPR